MPWKRCPRCGGLSYSAATQYDIWECPYCQKDLSGTPDHTPPIGPRHKAAEEQIIQ